MIKKKIKKKILIIVDDYKYRRSYKVLQKIVKISLIGRFGVIKFDNLKNISIEKTDKFINEVKGQEL